MMMDHNMSAKTVMNRIVAEVDASFNDEITLLMRKLLY
jgi:hypothetical protein